MGRLVTRRINRAIVSIITANPIIVHVTIVFPRKRFELQEVRVVYQSPITSLQS